MIRPEPRFPLPNTPEGDKIRMDWYVAEKVFISALERYHGDILPVGFSISIEILPHDPEHPTRYATSVCMHYSKESPPAKYQSFRRNFWHRLFGITPNIPWSGDI